MPLPRSLAIMKRQTSEKKCADARRWAEGPDYRTEVQHAGKQRSNRTVTAVSKRLAVRFHQLKTGHCLSGQYI